MIYLYPFFTISIHLHDPLNIKTHCTTLNLFVGMPVLGQLVDDYLLDFDIFHVSHVTELLHYIDAKYLSNEMGGSNPTDVDTWLNVQQHVDSFTIRATKIAKRLATFVKILNQEDISQHKNKDKIQEVSLLFSFFCTNTPCIFWTSFKVLHMAFK